MKPHKICINVCINYVLSDNNFVELLQYRFKRVDNGGQILSDIYDGCIYKEQSSFFSSVYNISFTLNFDGAPKFKSSNMQIWPVHLSINELPPSERYATIIHVHLLIQGNNIIRKNEHYMDYGVLRKSHHALHF